MTRDEVLELAAFRRELGQLRARAKITTKAAERQWEALMQGRPVPELPPLAFTMNEVRDVHDFADDFLESLGRVRK